jgi:hypothetical protein
LRDQPLDGIITVRLQDCRAIFHLDQLIPGIPDL